MWIIYLVGSPIAKGILSNRLWAPLEQTNGTICLSDKTYKTETKSVKNLRKRLLASNLRGDIDEENWEGSINFVLNSKGRKF